MSIERRTDSRAHAARPAVSVGMPPKEWQQRQTAPQTILLETGNQCINRVLNVTPQFGDLDQLVLLDTDDANGSSTAKLTATLCSFCGEPTERVQSSFRHHCQAPRALPQGHFSNWTAELPMIRPSR